MNEPLNPPQPAPQGWGWIVKQIHSHKPILACPKCAATSDRDAAKRCSGNEDNCPMDYGPWLERIVKLNIETIAAGFYGDPDLAEAALFSIPSPANKETIK